MSGGGGDDGGAGTAGRRRSSSWRWSRRPSSPGRTRTTWTTASGPSMTWESRYDYVKTLDILVSAEGTKRVVREHTMFVGRQRNFLEIL